MGREQYIRQLIEAEIQNGEIAGASVLALHKGKELYRGNFGMADKEKRIPMQSDRIFRMFSMTKPITAAAVLLLWERGRIALTDPVRQYLPGFEHQQVVTEGGIRPVKNTCTIFNLLTMTSGLPYPEEGSLSGQRMGELFAETEAKARQGILTDTMELANKIGQIPLSFEPGCGWQYGTSADVLGAVVEAADGRRFGTFLKEEFFEPLGMKDTGFTLSEKQRERLAQVYEKRADKALVPFVGEKLCLHDYKEDTAFESGGAGLVSTIDDYARFAQLLLNGGRFEGEQLLGRKTVEFMTRNCLTAEQRPFFNWDSLKGYGYGCLMRVLEDRMLAAVPATEGDFGWDGWTGNYFSVDKAEELVYLYFIQRTDSGTTEVTKRVKNVVYSMLP